MQPLHLQPNLQHRCDPKSGQISVNSVVLLTCKTVPFLKNKVKSESTVHSPCQGSLSTNSSQTKIHKILNVPVYLQLMSSQESIGNMHKAMFCFLFSFPNSFVYMSPIVLLL